MTSENTLSTEQFEWQMVQLLSNLQYTNIRRVGGEESISSFYAERNSPLGTDSIFVMLDFWRDEVVGRRQVEQAAGRMLVEPAKRLVVITRGRFDDAAREYARRVSVTLIEGAQLETLLSEANSGAGATTAFAAAVAADPAQQVREVAEQAGSSPPYEPSVPRVRARREPPPAGPHGPRRHPRGRPRVLETVPVEETPLGVQKLPPMQALLVFTAIILSIGLLSAFIVWMAEPDSSAAQVPVESSTVQIERIGNGQIVQVRGRTEPGRELALYENGALIDQTFSGEDGTFVFPFVPLDTGRPANELVVYAVSPEDRRGVVIWRNPAVPAPFMDEPEAAVE